MTSSHAIADNEKSAISIKFILKKKNQVCFYSSFWKTNSDKFVQIKAVLED